MNSLQPKKQQTFGSYSLNMRQPMHDDVIYEDDEEEEIKENSHFARSTIGRDEGQAVSAG